MQDQKDDNEETRTKRELSDLVAKLESGVKLSSIELNRLCRHRGNLELSDAVQAQLTQAITDQEYFDQPRSKKQLRKKWWWRDPQAE